MFLRYIGEGYSQAQESMEDEMREFYGPKQNCASPLQAPSSGQLLAVRAEEEEEILRAQICEVMVDKVKVRHQGDVHCYYHICHLFISGSTKAS